MLLLAILVISAFSLPHYLPYIPIRITEQNAALVGFYTFNHINPFPSQPFLPPSHILFRRNSESVPRLQIPFVNHC